MSFPIWRIAAFGFCLEDLEEMKGEWSWKVLEGEKGISICLVEDEDGMAIYCLLLNYSPL